VLVVSPGGLARAETRFAVGATGAVTQSLAAEHEALGVTAQNAVARVSAMVAALPASPAREEFEEKMGSLKKEVAKWPDESRRFRTALDSLQSAAQISPGFGAIVYKDVFAPLDEWREESKTTRTRIQEELDRSHVAQCDRIDHAIDGLKALGLVLSLVSRPGSLIFKVLNLAAGKIASIEPDAEKRTIIARVIKTLPPLAAEGEGQSVAGGFVKAGQGWITDLTRLGMGRVFARYCEKFSGPIHATLHGEYLRNGEPWWKFDQELRGRLTLRYARTDAGGAIPISGEFNGHAVLVGIWDNALASINPKLARYAQFFKRTILPKVADLASGALQNQGAVVTAAAPTGFNIPVEGELVDRTLTLRVKPATVDLTDFGVKVIYVAVSPLALGPVNGNYHISLMKAHNIITGALSNQEVKLPVVVDRAGSVMTIDRTFNGTRGSKAGLAYGAYSMTVNLKNPPS
jgi:hypothetical protein